MGSSKNTDAYALCMETDQFVRDYGNIKGQESNLPTWFEYTAEFEDSFYKAIFPPPHACPELLIAIPSEY